MFRIFTKSILFKRIPFVVGASLVSSAGYVHYRISGMQILNEGVKFSNKKQVHGSEMV